MFVRVDIVLISTFVLVPSLVFAADYTVPEGGTLAKAIAEANANKDGDMYEIEISGTSADSGNVKNSAAIVGNPSAVLSGSLAFNGTGVRSEISNLVFTSGTVGAVANGTLGLGEAQDLTITSVAFEQRTGNGYGGGVVNLGNMIIQGNSSFSENRADVGGAIYNSKVLDISDTSFLNNTASGSGGAINSSGTMSIVNSTFDGNRSVSSYGGAINSSGTARISGSVFKNNRASEGGAVYTSGNNASLTVADTQFIGNYTTINSQGVSDYGGAINSVGKLNIVNALFADNYATEAGAVKLRRGSTEGIIAASEFKNNYAVVRDGGAIVHSDGTLQIDGTKFTGNESQKGSGGAIFTDAALTVSGGSLFVGNRAADNGGAVSVASGADITVSDASFTENVAENGNGGAVDASLSVPLTVNGASFSRNHADKGYGGALYASGLNTVLKNVKFDGNTALYGGGIMNFGNLTIGGGSSFTNNKASAGGAVFTLGTLNLDTTEGDILFSGNKAEDVSEGGADIYLNTGGGTVVNIQGDANVLAMDGGFSGSGVINKTGGNTLVFGENADNSLFRGEFNQSAGTTLVYADNFFGGKNTVANGSALHFARSARFGNLNLEKNGRLDLRSLGAFSPNTLTVENLISDGTAVVGLQTDGTVSDLLRVTGSATGNITLDIDAVGTNPTRQKIEVVNVEEAVSDAEFELSGNKLDIGAYEYDLIREADTNWYLETAGDLTKTAKSVEGVPSLHLSIVNAGMNELRKRLGDLHGDNPNAPAGVWVRGYGKHLRVHEKTGARMDLLGMEGGIDVMSELFGGRTYFGAMGGYLSSDNIRVFQAAPSDARGHTKTPVAGLYATWIQNDTDWFVDLTARHFWVHTDLDNIFSNDGINAYDIKRNFWAFSAETGRPFEWNAPDFINVGSSVISVEPKFELRYVRGGAKNFRTDNGETGRVNNTHSMVTKLNVQTSYLPEGAKSAWKLFVELGVYNEWLGRTKLRFADVDLTTSDLSGPGFEASLGVNAKITDDAYLYGVLTLETGKAYSSYLFNAGLRVKF